MPVCVPLKRLEDADAFVRLVEESPEPVIVTREGREALVAMTPDALDALRLESARARLYELVAEGEEDIRAGRVYDARESQREVRERYGL